MPSPSAPPPAAPSGYPGAAPSYPSAPQGGAYPSAPQGGSYPDIGGGGYPLPPNSTQQYPAPPYQQPGAYNAPQQPYQQPGGGAYPQQPYPGQQPGGYNQQPYPGPDAYPVSVEVKDDIILSIKYLDQVRNKKFIVLAAISSTAKWWAWWVRWNSRKSWTHACWRTGRNCVGGNG